MRNRRILVLLIASILLHSLLRSQAAADESVIAGIADPDPVIGLYSVPIEACSTAAASGFTVIHSYDFESNRAPDPQPWIAKARPYLDAAHAHGLKVLLGLPRSWLVGRQTESIRTAMRAVREHPALLAWYEDERAQEGDLASVQYFVQCVEEEDPIHGAILEEGKDIPALRGLGRVRMFTYYPVTAQARDAGRLKTLVERMPVAMLEKPFWPVLQAYGRDLVRGYPKRDLVAPLNDEMSFTLCSALIHGARGFFIYTYMHSTTYDVQLQAKGKWPYATIRPLPEVSPSVWAAAGRRVRDGRMLLAFLRDARPSASMQVTAPKTVEVGQWESPAGVLVVLANPRYRDEAVTIRVDNSIVAVAQLEDGCWVPMASPQEGTTKLLLDGPVGTSLLFQRTAAP